jgi:hypothetical protein
MKYWNSGLNAPGSRTFIATVHIAAAVIGWRRSGKERTGQTQFSTKFAAKLCFIPRWSSVYLFFPVFWNLVPYGTKQGVLVPSLPDFTDNFMMLNMASSPVMKGKKRRNGLIEIWIEGGTQLRVSVGYSNVFAARHVNLVDQGWSLKVPGRVSFKDFVV